MNRHTSELYRLAELPAFIEEALSNVSLKAIIEFYIHGDGDMLIDSIERATHEYAEQWVGDWMARDQPNLWNASHDWVDHEIKAIEAGVALFSNPDCKAGLPE